MNRASILIWTLIVGSLSVWRQPPAQAAETWTVGFGKVEITPTEPVRLSGYATRDKPHTGVADPLFARAMVLTKSPDSRGRNAADLPTKEADGTRSLVLISVDSIAVVPELTQHVGERLLAEYGLSRSEIVICSTHSHAAPHADAGLPNLYRTPLSPEEQAAIARHAKRVEEGICKAVTEAMRARQAAKLEVAQSQVQFAVNRRVLKNGLWSGFGVQSDGPVDHRVQLLRAVGEGGELLGAAFMYACHCTTLGPDFNQVSADWAGLSATELESKHPGSVFLPVIGCGADANPEPRTSYQDAQKHGSAMAASVESALSGHWTNLTHFPVGHFGYAGLAPEMPTRAELEVAKSDKDVVRRRWAESMLDIWNKMGRLPETYPAPIHTWRFGDELLWVFLGGEVVIDYQIRLEKNLPAKQVWVAAYCDDVFAYVASERMRAEGGYEVDFSMLYYNQPGRWQTGTEDLIERRVIEILEEDVPGDKPRNPQAALRSIRVPESFEVDLMASEPMVDDPVNIAFGHDGRVWVVEMGDYPLGSAEGGRVRWLRDNDRDGKFDESQLFLSGLEFPSSVTPWRDGVIVITSPAIYFAADRDGDGRAEFREELLQGFAHANPQHRASGFEMGLDGWLNFTCGDGTQDVKSTRNGQTSNVAGRDIRWQADSGQFNTTTGHTQFIRSRDEFDNWFGNVNNQPMFHYVIEDTYRRRPGASGPAYQHLLEPPVAPPVYPFSHTQDRFNDLFTFNRFTSACSSIICRVPGLGDEMRGAALVCEPVHNLVARFKVKQDGASFTGERFEDDSQYDWFASSDPFSRPVRVVNAPDGTVWIVDMVRQVIEHPEWIPTAWQDRLNVRAGAGLGRIYRVHKQSYQPPLLPNVELMADLELVALLDSDNGALRDLAAQQLIWRATAQPQARLTSASDAIASLKALAEQSAFPAARAQALGTLVGMSQGDVATVAARLSDSDARVRRYAVVLMERWLEDPNFSSHELGALAKRERDPAVLVQLALSLGSSESAAFLPAIEALAAHATEDVWLCKALALVDKSQVEAALQGILRSLAARAADCTRTANCPEGSGSAPTEARMATLEQTISSLWARSQPASRLRLLTKHFASTSGDETQLSDMQIILLTAVASAGLDKLSEGADLQIRLASAVATARTRLFTEGVQPEERIRLIPLLPLSPSAESETLVDIGRLLDPRESIEVQHAALNVARRLRAPDTPRVLLSKWSQLFPDIRSSVCAVLLERKAWGEELIAHLESGAIKVNDLDAAVIERLRSYGDRSLMARSQRVLGQPPNKDRTQIVNEALAQLKHPGNSLAGEKHFVEHCAACHRVSPSKPLVGPPLENITNWNSQQWLVAILDPNRTIEPKYHQYSLLTADGQTLSGLIEDRTSHHLTLAASDGKRHEVELAQIEQIRDLGTSLMPEGLETKLSPAALSDLMAYIQTLGAPKQ